MFAFKEGGPSGRSTAMTIKQKLQNPLALVAQGFVAGAILFWATVPSDAEQQQQSSSAQTTTSTTEIQA